MTASLAALLALLVFGIASWGWGRMVLTACRVDPQGGVAYLAVLGLAALAAVGGWLNLLGIAYAPVLWLLLLAGWVEAGRRGFAARASLTRALAGWRVLVPALVIALVAIALSLVLLPSSAFNPWDDFQLYLPRPVRMLQGGTLGRNPFDLLGLDSLGAHAFLQAFPLLVLPVAYFNAFDAVLCAVLVLALVASIGRSLQLGATVIVAAFVAMALTPARQLNVSATFAISAFALALVPASRPLLDPAQTGAWFRRALPLGLVLAALAGCKMSTLSFLLPWGLCCVLACVAVYGWVHAWRSAVTGGAAAIACLLPWIALYAGNYAAWLARQPAGTSDQSALTAFFAGLRWGLAGSVPEYNAIAAIVVAAAAAAIWRSSKASAAQRTQILPLVALCAAAAAGYAATTQLPIDIRHIVRYSAPALIAAAPVAVLLAAWVCGAAGWLVALAVPLLMGVLLAGQGRERLHKTLAYRSVLTFSESDMPRHQSISEWGLARKTREWMVRAQGSTRPGETVLAFTQFPHHLLFARNPVLVASPAGLIAPWLNIVPGSDPRAWLASYRIRYVIWDRSGYFQSDQAIAQLLASPVEQERLSARRILWLRDSLESLAASAAVVHADQGLLVIDLAAMRDKP